jgi:hypothetical protein
VKTPAANHTEANENQIAINHGDLPGESPTAAHTARVSHAAARANCTHGSSRHRSITGRYSQTGAHPMATASRRERIEQLPRVTDGFRSEDQLRADARGRIRDRLGT